MAKRKKAQSCPANGPRVAVSPAHDRFMMGDRYGTICKRGTRGKRKNATQVKLDRSGKTMWFHNDYIEEI